jgi:2-acylglycerol O-acyltransferase 2
MFFGVLIYSAWIFVIPLLIIGSLYTKLLLIALLIYQYCFAKKSEAYRDFLRSLNPVGYFKSHNVIFEDEPERHNSLFAFHPHGVMSFGTSLSMAKNDVLYDSILCGSRALLNLPISGIFARLMGIEGVNNSRFKDIMKSGHNIAFLPGGFEEATLTTYDRERVFIKNRKGFIKYALDYGYKIYPCYTFGENRLFYTLNLMEQFRLMLNRFKLPGTFFFSKYLLLPNDDVDILTIIGKPIIIPKINNPTNEDIDKYHSIYINTLQELFDKYKSKTKSHTLEIC